MPSSATVRRAIAAVVGRRSAYRPAPMWFRAHRVYVALAVLTLGVGAYGLPPALIVQDRALTGSLPKGVSISPDGATLYVTNYGNTNGDNVGVYDVATLRRTAWIYLPGVAVESAVSPDGRRLYVSDFRDATVHFIRLRDRRTLRSVAVGRHPKVLALTHDGARLFAANWSGRSVSEVDTATGAVVRTHAAGHSPRGLAVARDGTLYVANFHSDSLDVFAGPERAERRRVEGVCHVPRHLALSPDERRLYVSCLGDDALLVLDAHSLALERRVPVGDAPKAVDVSADGRVVATADYGGSTVTLVDTDDWTTRSVELPTMDHASGIVAARAGHRFFVTGWYDNHVYAVGADAGRRFVASERERVRVAAQRIFHARSPVE
jgi:YVTN family beta-propeller protein